MPIRLLLEHDHAFTPEHVKILNEIDGRGLREDGAIGADAACGEDGLAHDLLGSFFVPLVSVHESLLLLVIEHESMSDVDHDTVTVYPF